MAQKLENPNPKGRKALEEIIEFYERHLEPVDLEECRLQALLNNTITEELQRMIHYADALRQTYEKKYKEKYGNDIFWD